MAQHWNTALGSAGFDPLYDVDESGAITVRDILLVAAHFGEACAQ